LVQNINKALEESGMLVAEFSRRTNIHHSNMTKILRGEQNLTVETVEKLASVLGVPTWKLFQNIEDLNAAPPRAITLSESLVLLKEHLEHLSERIDNIENFMEDVKIAINYPE
jgi:transcriptional regulator with XRE-family HTH domain